jgi:hypothetical protein
MHESMLQLHAERRTSHSDSTGCARTCPAPGFTALLHADIGLDPPASYGSVDEVFDPVPPPVPAQEQSASLPKWLLRSIACLILAGQVAVRILKGRIHVRNTLDQLKLVGPRSLGVALLTAGFVGMVFTIQVRAWMR